MATSRGTNADVTERKLASWKSIAEYFDCDERTAKRWGRERGLPVHRMPGGKRSVVFAYTSELDNWLRTRDLTESDKSGTVTNEAGVRQGLASSVSVENVLAAGEQPKPVAVRLPLRQRLSPVWYLIVTICTAILIVGATVRWTLRERYAAHAKSAGMPPSSPPLRHVPQPGAEQLYFRGRYFWNLRTATGLTNAVDAYTQAIVEDPSYAEAYAGLAETYDLLPQFGKANLVASLTKAINAANRAIELNPDLADAHQAKAFAIFYLNWDIAGSDAEFKRALALYPDSSQAHHWYASTLHTRMEGSACLREIDEALRLNPTSAAIATDAAFFHADFDDLDAGIRALKEIERTQANLATPPSFLAALDFARGDFPGYIAEARRYATIRDDPQDAALADAVARGWLRSGRIGLLEERAKALKAAFDLGDSTGSQLAETLLLLGRTKEALPYFRAALDRRDIGVLVMLQCPWAQTLWRDPDYAALRAQIRQHVYNGSLASPSAVPFSEHLPG